MAMETTTGFFAVRRFTALWMSWDALTPPPGESMRRMTPMMSSSSSSRLIHLVYSLDSKITPVMFTTPKDSSDATFFLPPCSMTKNVKAAMAPKMRTTAAIRINMPKRRG